MKKMKIKVTFIFFTNRNFMKIKEGIDYEILWKFK